MFFSKRCTDAKCLENYICIEVYMCRIKSAFSQVYCISFHFSPRSSNNPYKIFHNRKLEKNNLLHLKLIYYRKMIQLNVQIEKITS